MSAERFQIGLKLRKEVMGKRHVEQTLADTDEFNHDFQKLITEYCWGATWGRGVLSNQQRSLNNLCLLAAQNRPEEFKLHFRGALRNGCSLDELRETLLQITAYCGVPTGDEVFRLGREVLREEGIEVAPQPLVDPPK